MKERLIKWAIQVFLIPLIKKLFESAVKQVKKRVEVKNIEKTNRAKTSAYENNPSDENFENLP
jgi:hypothetical protein